MEENTTGSIKQHKYRAKVTVSFYPDLQVLERAEGRVVVRGCDQIVFKQKREHSVVLSEGWSTFSICSLPVVGLYPISNSFP